MDKFKIFLKSQAVNNILNFFKTGAYTTKEQLRVVKEVVDEKIVFEDNVNIDSSSYYELMTSTEQISVLAVTNYDIQELLESHEKSFQYFHLVREWESNIKKFNIVARKFILKIKDFTGELDPITWLKNVLNEILEYALRSFHDDDRVGLVFNNEALPEKPLSTSIKRRDQLSPDIVLEIMGSVLQSNATFLTNDRLILDVVRIQLPRGNGNSTGFKGLSFKEFCSRKTGIAEVKNEDNACLAYALVLAMARHESPEAYSNVLTNQLLWKEKADRLCRKVGVDLSNGGTYDHIQQLQTYLDKYTIVVYNSREGSRTYFEGPRTDDRLTLNLILEQNHYNVILSLTAAFSSPYYCERCKRRYSSKYAHKGCPFICPCCHAPKPCNKDLETIECSDCKRTFRGTDCFKLHKQKKLCSVLHRCMVCFNSYVIDKKNSHKCGIKYCRICLEIKPIRHLCYMQPYVIGERKLASLYNKFLFVFYDFECRQEKDLPGGRFLHEPNLCVAQQVCPACITVDNMNIPCVKCGTRLHIFQNNPVQKFLEYLQGYAKDFNVTAIAHNMKGYDGCFIVRQVLSEVERWNPKIIRNGCKFVSITCINSIKFIDSLNYMPLPLAKLPAAFKFEETINKEYFPHLFNTKRNENYLGPLPDPSFYMPDAMSNEERINFFQWYNQQVSNNATFYMPSEIVNYCIKDVEILRKACIKFRNFFVTCNKIDPFQQAVTLPGACNLVFRNNFLKRDSIGIIPNGGYRFCDNQSDIALKWMTWLEKSLNIKIQHAGNAREVRLPQGFLVDGFCAENNTAYEFYGCYFHGCGKCFSTPKLQKKVTAFLERNKNTKNKEARILAAGYNLVQIWECEFRSFLSKNSAVKNLLKQNIMQKQLRLNPRDGFYGGRTNAVKLYHKCPLEDDEKLCYFDVCSMYPYINKYRKYPVGHPKVHIGDEDCRKIPINTFEGLIKCSILPPDNLYHPVLPYRCNGKLTFPLCRTCVENSYQLNCEHTDNQRKFTGTFVADELRKALSLNYKLEEIFEIWEYSVEVYDKETKTGGLFAGYIDNFLKIKQECSGWPNWCTTEELKQSYLEQYAAKEGIHLDNQNISHNPGMRYISKLMLNSFWGKFGQRENQTQTTIVKQSMELYNLLTNPSIIVRDITIVDEDVLLVSWDKHEDEVTPLRNVNVVVAAYTTAAARLELYNYLEKLGERVMYFDTDSVIFSAKPGEWMPEVGDYLGQMKDEIAEYGVDSRITEFVSGGPKNYALKIYSTDKCDYVYVCKVKGITLNFKTSKTVNFDVLKGMVCDNADAVKVYNDRKICRTSTFEVISRPEGKTFRINVSKRRRLENSYNTLPYGYRDM